MEKKHIAEEVAARIVATMRGKSETVEKEGRRVKEEQVKVKEDYRRMNQPNTKEIFAVSYDQYRQDER